MPPGRRRCSAPARRWLPVAPGGTPAAPVGARPALLLDGVSWPAVRLAALCAGGPGRVGLLLRTAGRRFRAVLPDWVAPLMERVVGATLVLLGVWLTCSL